MATLSISFRVIVSLAPAAWSQEYKQWDRLGTLGNLKETSYLLTLIVTEIPIFQNHPTSEKICKKIN